MSVCLLCLFFVFLFLRWSLKLNNNSEELISVTRCLVKLLALLKNFS